MSFTIRHATKADCKNIWRLIKELAVHEGKLQQVMQSYEDFEQDAYSQKPWFESLIAEVPKENKSQKGFTTVGLALYYYTYSTWKGRSVYLEDLYVMSEFRGFGIGKSLLNTLAKVAREKQCVEMKLNVFGQNSHSRAFYAAQGAQDVTVLENWHTQRFNAEMLDKLAKKAP